MTTFERTRTTDVSAEHVYEYISQVENLADYMDEMTSAKRVGPEKVDVTAVVEVPDEGEKTFHNEAWFRTNDDDTSIEWGSDNENDYHGELRVSSTGDSSAEMSLSIHTLNTDSESVEKSIDVTLDNIAERIGTA